MTISSIGSSVDNAGADDGDDDDDTDDTDDSGDNDEADDGADDGDDVVARKRFTSRRDRHML